MGDLARGPAPPRRRRLLVIMMLLLLPIAAAYDKGLHRHAVAKLKPSRPQRPSKKGANNTGPVPPPPPFPGTPALFVGTPSTVNASDLPTPKPDPTPPDPAIRAVKRAWRLPTGTTSTIDIAGEMAPAGERLGGNHDNENDNVGDLERRRRLTKEKRRLALTAKQNFAGIPNIQGYTPPDTIGTIGPNHYVQAVNTLYAVYDRFTGAALVTPRAINTLFAGSGLWCASRNDGDPTVNYDPTYNRWIIAQFTTAAPYGQCVAVSTGPNPTGTYYRYFFSLSQTVLYDYPRAGIWRDTLSFSFNKFGTGYQGPSILFINKLDLYNGLVAGSVRWMVNNQVSGAYGTLLPVDVDGPVEPPAGSLVPFFSLGSQLYRFNYQLNYDARTATLVSTQAVAGNYAFQQLCPSATGCVPQLGTNRLLDTLGDRLMNRVAYRNFGTYDVVLISHTINVLSSGTQGGVRWYEVRNIAYGSPVNVLRQFGNYAPDTNWRWMSSIAMDKVGNIAIGYSKSSGGMFPAIAASGRLATDPLNTMTQTGSNRWGDYSNLAIDPVDQCTFWFTTLYMASTSPAGWSTRIASFVMPGCLGGPTPAPTVPPVGPSPRPTLIPTPLPTQAQPGSCGLPIALQFGANSVDVRPASGTVVDYAGTTCNFAGFSSIFEAKFYSYTPPLKGTFQFSTCNAATWDTKIAVMASCNPSSVLSCNDDGSGCSSFTSITPPVILNAGVTYIIALGAYDDRTAVGAATLTVSGTFFTSAPTRQPSQRPTGAPVPPTNAPSQRPTGAPSKRPTARPTALTVAPSRAPSRTPTRLAVPTRRPSRSPTRRPSRSPTKTPTRRPTVKPPTRRPTRSPTKRPTRRPTPRPTPRPAVT